MPYKADRISREVAIAAKRVGFPQQSGYGYVAENTELGLYRGFATYYASSQAELQKWLRDEHGLHIQIAISIQPSNEGYVCSVVDVNKPQTSSGGFVTPLYYFVDAKVKSYELGLEKSLVRALNLLPDATN